MADNGEKNGSEQMTSAYPFIEVTHENVQQVAKIIHMECLRYMEIPPRSLNELCFLGLALGGEVGELQNLMKKVMRERKVTPEMRTAIAEEVADVFAYLFHIAGALGMDIGLAFRQKMSHLVNERQPEWLQGSLPRLAELYGKEAENDETH